MKLFEIIKENLFSPLASPRKYVHMRALEVLHNEFKGNWRLTKDELAATLADRLKDDKKYYEFEEEDAIEDRSYSGFAYMILRKLRATGWIEYEHGEDDFEDHIIIPDYAVMILETFEKIASQDTREYNKYVYLTFSALKTANDMKQDYYRALTNAYSQSRELELMLHVLLGNIKRYHKKLTEHNDVKRLVEQHFDEFKPKIMDKVYSPLKTVDSVPRYKDHIIRILNSWILDDDIMNEITIEGNRYKEYEDEYWAHTMVQDIVTIYENVQGMLILIDKKNAAYTKATAEKMEYMINGDDSINGKLASLLSMMPDSDGEIFRIEKTQYSNITFESIKMRPKKKVKKPTKRLKIATKPTFEEIAKEMNELKKEVDEAYTTKQIRDYINSRLDLNGVFSVSELSNIGDEDFTKLLLACVHCDDNNSDYDIKLHEGRIRINNYIIPNITYVRR